MTRTFAQVDAELRRSRDAMDASTFSGRNRTHELLQEREGLICKVCQLTDGRHLPGCANDTAPRKQYEPMTLVHPGAHISFEYFNHRDDTATRTVVFKSLEYGSNEWYPEPQWFMRCYDLDRGAERSFAILNITPGSLKVLL